MENILRENNNFQMFSKYCEEKSRIERELSDPGISDEKKINLEERLACLRQEISELRVILQDEIKVL